MRIPAKPGHHSDGCEAIIPEHAGPVRGLDPLQWTGSRHSLSRVRRARPTRDDDLHRGRGLSGGLRVQRIDRLSR
jgi:hypothetical protein